LASGHSSNHKYLQSSLSEAGILKRTFFTDALKVLDRPCLQQFNVFGK
jgi:hypothetical protein